MGTGAHGCDNHGVRVAADKTGIPGISAVLRIGGAGLAVLSARALRLAFPLDSR
jgi:hypothetical protein